MPGPSRRPDFTYLQTMKYLIALLCLATPAAAWEFSPVPVCTLEHTTDTAAVTVTYDPAAAAQPYAIAITGEGLAPAPVFAIRFDGPRGLTITTDRHELTAGTVTVRDRGFGNVLNGIEFGETATAILGTTEIAFPLTGADAPTQAFRACIAAPLA